MKTGRVILLRNYRPVHTPSGMRNQGKKQSSKIYVYLLISILRFISERKLIPRNPFSVFTSIFELIELGISLLTRVTETLFLWLKRLRLD